MLFQTPTELYNLPPYELVNYLTAHTHSEIEAAYAIFRWVTCLPVSTAKTHDANAKEYESAKGQPKDELVDQSLSHQVYQLKDGIITHADIFSLLCK